MARLRPKGYRRPRNLAGLRYRVPGVKFARVRLYSDWTYSVVVWMNR